MASGVRAAAEDRRPAEPADEAAVLLAEDADARVALLADEDEPRAVRRDAQVEAPPASDGYIAVL